MSIRLEHVSYAYEDNSSKKNYALKDVNLEIKKEKTSISNKYAYKNVEVKEYSGMSNFTMELYLVVKKKNTEVSLEDIASSLNIFKEYEDKYYYAVYNSETNLGGYNEK